MRVLQLVSGDGWGGAEVVTAHLVEGLVASGKVDLTCLVLNNGRLASVLADLGVPVHVISEANRPFVSVARDVRRWIRERDFDVVHAHRYKEFLVSILATTPGQMARVMTVHGLPPRSQSDIGTAAAVWLSLWASRASRSAIVSVSEEIQKRIQRLGAGPCVHIPNPMPSTRPLPSGSLHRALGWPANRPAIGFVGRLEEIKGPDLFIDIASRSPSSLGFCVIGSGSLEVALKKRVEFLGLSDRIAFLGQVDDPLDYIADMKLVAVTSRHEGIPMIILEAAACRVPVVAFAVGGVPEVLRAAPRQWMVPPGAVSEFSTAIQALVDDLETSNAMAQQWARSVEADYALPKIITAYLDIYRGQSA